MANAELMAPWIKKWEGGYVNDPDDRGGCTNTGITIAVYRKYYGSTKTCSDLKKITDEQWLHIFKTGYWNKMKADDIKSQAVAELCVQMCWGSGPVTAIKKIQLTLGTTADGVVGPKTLALLNQDEDKVFSKLYDMRMIWLANIATQGNNCKFLKGWINRLSDLKKRHNK